VESVSVGSALLAVWILLTTLLFRSISRKRDPVIWNHRGWKSLYLALGWTCIMFLVGEAARRFRVAR
jgi:O-antigen ligase